MIIPAVSSIGIQCSKCGQLQFRSLSAFSFSHFGRESFACACGAPLVTLSSFERGSYKIDYPCIYCGNVHSLLTKRKLIWGEELIQLTCKEKDLPIGYIGPENLVTASCQEIKKLFVQLASELVNDEEIETEFDNFFIVYAVMEKLSKMVERGQLGCCCGNNNLSVEILGDRIELVCQNCHAVGTIYTDNKDILRIIDGMGVIFLEENMTWFLNSPYKGGNLVKNK